MRFYAALVFSFLYAPLLILIAFSFNDGRFTVWEGFSIRWYSAAVADPQLGEALVNSLIIGCLSAILSTAIGTLAAYGIWRKPLHCFRRRFIFRLLHRRSLLVFLCSHSSNGYSDFSSSGWGCTR